MAIEGTLDELRLPDILQTVAQQRKTGILTIQGEETIVAVSFLSGQVVTADSLAETVEERLSRLLAREGLVEQAALDELAARADAGEGRLADLLVAEGRLTRRQLLDSLRSQTLDLLHDLVTWRRGEFKFYAGDQVSYEEGFEPISVENLLLSWLDDPALAGDEPVAPRRPVVVSDARRVRAASSPPAEPLRVADPLEATRSGVTAFAAPLHAAVEPPAALAVLLDAAGAGEGPLADVEDPAAVVEPEERLFAGEPAAAVSRAATVPAGLPAFAAAALTVALVAAVLLAPGRFLLAFPWQLPERAALTDLQAQASHLAIDRAAKTFFLLEGRFPESLDRLVALGLLEGSQIRDPEGRPLEYAPHEDSYDLVSPAAGGAAVISRSEAITGNFLLDPELLSAPRPALDEKPLVLLD